MYGKYDLLFHVLEDLFQSYNELKINIQTKYVLELCIHNSFWFNGSVKI